MGIVEFTPELPTVNWELRTVLHFENYSRIVSEAAEQHVNILVFPEYTLNNVAFPVEVPDPMNEISPCLEPDQFDNLLVDLSCLARENEIYLCINLSEKTVQRNRRQLETTRGLVHLSASLATTPTSCLTAMEPSSAVTENLICFAKLESTRL